MFKYNLALIIMIVISSNCNLRSKKDENIHNELVELIKDVVKHQKWDDEQIYDSNFASLSNEDIVYELHKIIANAENREEIYFLIFMKLKNLKEKNYYLYHNVDQFISENL